MEKDDLLKHLHSITRAELLSWMADNDITDATMAVLVGKSWRTVQRWANEDQPVPPAIALAVRFLQNLPIRKRNQVLAQARTRSGQSRTASRRVPKT